MKCRSVGCLRVWNLLARHNALVGQGRLTQGTRSHLTARTSEMLLAHPGCYICSRERPHSGGSRVDRVPRRLPIPPKLAMQVHAPGQTRTIRRHHAFLFPFEVFFVCFTPQSALCRCALGADLVRAFPSPLSPSTWITSHGTLCSRRVLRLDQLREVSAWANNL